MVEVEAFYTPVALDGRFKVAPVAVCRTVVAEVVADGVELVERTGSVAFVFWSDETGACDARGAVGVSYRATIARRNCRLADTSIRARGWTARSAFD